MRKNGCFDRPPLKSRVMVQDGWIYGGDVRMAKVKEIPDPMTKTCNYTTTTLGQVDPQCVGCKHKEAK